MAKIGDTFELHGYGTLIAAPEALGCDGCLGANYGPCMYLPGGCSGRAGIVWMRLGDVPVPPHPFEEPYGNPTGPQDSPSKAYKPPHGGYPGTPRPS